MICRPYIIPGYIPSPTNNDSDNDNGNIDIPYHTTYYPVVHYSNIRHVRDLLVYLVLLCSPPLTPSRLSRPRSSMRPTKPGSSSTSPPMWTTITAPRWARMYGAHPRKSSTKLPRGEALSTFASPSDCGRTRSVSTDSRLMSPTTGGTDLSGAPVAPFTGEAAVVVVKAPATGQRP